MHHHIPLFLSSQARMDDGTPLSLGPWGRSKAEQTPINPPFPETMSEKEISVASASETLGIVCYWNSLIRPVCASYRPGTARSVSHATPRLSSTTILGNAIFYYPALQIRKLKPREVKFFAQGHAASKSQQGVHSHTKGRKDHPELSFLGENVSCWAGVPQTFPSFPEV